MSTSLPLLMANLAILTPTGPFGKISFANARDLQKPILGKMEKREKERKNKKIEK
jgi:hypothetical protein